MANLVIDIGNTTQKVAVFESRKLLAINKYSTISVRELKPLLEEFAIEKSILSAVGNHDGGIVPYLESNTRYIPFSHESRLPIAVKYATPETLGLDRIANAVAARHRFPDSDVLSIQLGSCIVYDFLNAKGEYLGGAISPGLRMRLKALNTFTAALPLIDLGAQDTEDETLFGNDTESSIRCGVKNGVIDEINASISRYYKEYPNLKVLVTGGDSEHLKNSIKNAIFAGSNSVLEGLNIILEINAEQ